MPEQYFSRLPESWVSIDGRTFRRDGRVRDDNVDFDFWVTACRRCGGEHQFLIQCDRPLWKVKYISIRYHSVCRGCRKEHAR